MAEQQLMPDKNFEFLSAPGIRRDGTPLESDFYSNGEWVRWQRGKPRKMGGYRAMSQVVEGPVRSLLIDSRNGLNTVHYFSRYGVQRQQFSSSGAGGGVEDRTPIGYFPGAGSPTLTWSHGVMASSTGGTFAALLAAATPDLDDITSDVTGPVFTGGMSDSLPLTPLSDSAGLLMVSGGVCVLQPFPMVFGSAGLVRIGNPNDLSPTSWDTGGSSLAVTANPAGTKMVYAAPVRGGSQAPAGLIWGLDSLVRVSFNPGSLSTLWNFDTLSNPTSIMSKKCVVEHDGKFYWIGTDRFLVYNGVVQELPNQMNCNWFFDNLNYTMRNKVWGTKVPRWGEIWWFYPRGADTECNDAIIWNYLENTWYDAVKRRSAGAPPQLFPFPIWAGGEDKQDTTVLPVGLRLATSAQTALGNNTLTFVATTGVANGMRIASEVAGIAPTATVASFTATTVVMSAVSTAIIPAGTPVSFSTMASPFVIGEIVTGGTSGAVGQVIRASVYELNLINVTGTFAATETLTGNHGGSASKISASYAQELHTSYQQEYGVDKILGSQVLAIPASFTSKHFGWAVGTPFASQPVTDDVMTYIGRMELDFGQIGELTFTVSGRSFAQDTDRVLETLVAQPTDSFVEFRCQERIVSLKVESNVVGGAFEQGQVMLKLSQGDERSSKNTGGDTE